MKFVMETEEGKKLDTNSVKYITLDGVEYAMMPVVQSASKLKEDIGSNFVQTL